MKMHMNFNTSFGKYVWICLLFSLTINGYAQWNPNVNGINYNGGKVGIGTTLPTSILQMESELPETIHLKANKAGVVTPVGAKLKLEVDTDRSGRGILMTHGNKSDRSASEWYAGVPYGGNGFQIANVRADSVINRVGESWLRANARFFITEAGKVGIGTYTPATKLDVNGTMTVGHDGDNSVLTFNANNGKSAMIGVQDDSNAGFYVATQGKYRLSVRQEGGVGIGTRSVPSGYLLAVNGRVICEELRVDLSQNWPDYVFADNYKLMPLKELGKYIETNRHLPGIPAAKEMENHGLAVGEMQRKLMEKVEELTLYLLDQQKTIEAQQATIDELKAQFK